MAERLAAALQAASEAIATRLEVLEAELAADRAAGEKLAAELRECAAEESRVHARVKQHGEEVTRGEVRAQQARDQAAGRRLRAQPARDEARPRARAVGAEPLPEGERAQLHTRIERLQRRREQLGPVNPLAQQEYKDALEHVEELEAQRHDLETALRELNGLIRDTDRRIKEAFEETFEAAAKNFEEVVGHLFPGGRGACGSSTRTPARARCSAARKAKTSEPVEEEETPEDKMGVEIEITPAGKSTKRLTLLSGGEKSLTALAFLFAVFLARPCPFYILDEVEAALDDLNIDRFLTLLRSLLGPRAVHRRDPPEAHDGGRRRAVRCLDGRQRRLESDLAPAAAARGRGGMSVDGLERRRRFGRRWPAPPPSPARWASSGSAAVVGSAGVAGSAGVSGSAAVVGSAGVGLSAGVVGSAGILAGLGNVGCAGCVACIGCVNCIGGVRGRLASSGASGLTGSARSRQDRRRASDQHSRSTGILPAWNVGRGCVSQHQLHQRTGCVGCIGCVGLTGAVGKIGVQK